ncbi:hypothetical protein [Pseudobacillus badius]|uniref:hypothetical protein n=1 Tax=Bacillus badius TaxID=1455 RepID=UPI000596C54C|nr:hypothetical protein [Bacillus badius]UAT32391.1 hypothetical protein K7T73_09355 [Bacillus badius]GLY12604.1 hypothetical protein Bbad01_38200 [Bacillus badius]
MKMRTEILNIKEIVRVAGDEEVVVFYKEARFMDENTADCIQGYINIVYSFAGLDLSLTLELCAVMDKDGSIVDRVFKLPFCDEPKSLWDLHMERKRKEWLTF